MDPMMTRSTSTAFLTTVLGERERERERESQEGDPFESDSDGDEF